MNHRLNKVYGWIGDNLFEIVYTANYNGYEIKTIEFVRGDNQFYNSKGKLVDDRNLGLTLDCKV